EEPRRATRVAFAFHVALSDVDLRELGFAGVPVRLQVTGLERPALFVYPCGGVLVEQHVRRPTTRRLHVPGLAADADPGSVCCAVSLAGAWCGVPPPVQVVLRPDPACVHVDCAGPVREDVPSHGFLGEGLTGENDRLKRGLQSRTPAIPLLSRIGSGSSDVASFRTGKNRIAAGRIVRAVPQSNPPPNYFPLRPCGLVDRLS